MNVNPESQRVTTIPLRSLRCRACAYRLIRRLRAIEGVREARIDAVPPAAFVTHDLRLDPARLVEALRAGAADPAAEEIAIPLATVAGAEEAATRIEREVTALEGVDAAAVDLIRHEIRAVHHPPAATAEAIRRRIASFGLTPGQPATDAAGSDPAQKNAAQRTLSRAIVATIAATAVTILGALTGPGALAPFLQLIPGAGPALRRSIGIAPVAALWLAAAIALGAVGWCGAELFRRAAGDVRRALVTGRVLGATAIAILLVVSVWGAADAVLRRPSPPLLFGVTVWSLAALLWGHAIMLRRALRRRERDTALDPHLRSTLAGAAWHRGAREERSLRHARAWAFVGLAAGIIAGAAWMAVGSSWSIAALAAAAVFLAASPASFIAAAAQPVRGAVEDLAARGIAILGGDTLDRIRRVETVATNIRGGLCGPRARIGELLLLQGAPVEELLAAARAAIQPDHPLATLICERAGTISLAVADPSVGTARDMDARGIDTSAIAEDVARFEAEGKSVLAVATGRRLLGALTIVFDAREEASEATAWLNARGVRTVLLTRNPEGTGAALASRHGFSAFEGGLTSPFDSPLLSGTAETGLRAWVSDQSDALSIGRADVAVTFAPSPQRIAREDAVVTTGSFGAIRALFEGADAASRSATARTRWLLAYHLLALPVAGGALLPVTGLLPAPFLAAIASVAALALAGASGQRDR